VQRAKKDLTQEGLAELVQVTRKTINTVENGYSSLIWNSSSTVTPRALANFRAR